MEWNKSVENKGKLNILEKSRNPVANEMFSAGWCNLNCVSGDTKILMSDFSYKEIKDVKLNDEIMGFDEYTQEGLYKHRKIYPTKVAHTFEREVDKILKITFGDNSIILITPNHKILKRRKRRDNQWKEASKFKSSQIIVSFQNIEEKTNVESYDYKVGYIIGMMKGDGSCKKYPYHYNIRLAVKDTEIINRSEKFFKDIGIEGFYKKPFRISTYQGDVYEDALFSGRKDIYEQIQELYKENFNKNKSYDYACGFLAGIYDAEGNIGKKSPTIRISNTDEEILNEIESSLDIIDIPHKREDYKNACSNIRILSPPYMFNTLKFIKIVKPAVIRKGLKNFYNRSVLKHKKIVSIEEINEKTTVYNLETESSTYIANNVFLHNCNYCYIVKQPFIKDVHREIIRRVEDGSYLKWLKEMYGDSLEHISHWGTEPTLTLRHFNDFYDQALDTFPNLKNIMLSSNFMTNIKVLINFVKNFSLRRKMNFDFQVSLDGPAWITDKNRQKSSAEIIVKNLLTFIKEINQHPIYHNVKMHFKPTTGMDDIIVLSDINKLDEYYTYFDNIMDEIVNLNKFNNIYFAFSCDPTIVVPYDYTTQDGKDFYKLYLTQMELREKKKYKHVYPECSYYTRFMEKARFYREFYIKNSMFSCSAGDSQMALREDGSISPCHRFYYFNWPEHKVAETKIDNKVIDFIEENYTCKCENFEETYKFLRVNRAFHDFCKHRLATGYTFIQEMKECRQISSEYENEELAKNLAVFLETQTCPVEHLIKNGSLFISPTEMVKLFGNGVFESLFKRAKEYFNVDK